MGCGTSPGTSPRAQVQAKVEQFAHATASRDYATLCNQVLAPDLIRHLTAAGLSCQQAMKLFAGSVKNPSLSVAKVTVKGKTASTTVLASATGQQSSVESIQLIDTDDGWRLESLASPR
jgi:uncharacterized protein YoaH (UPF0181 family)